MRKLRLLPVIGLVAVIATGCASTSQPPVATVPAEQVIDVRDYVALRDFSLRSAPSMEAPDIARIHAGDSFSATETFGSQAEWRKLSISAGPTGYVFGTPYAEN
tara:strand:+ start:207 stop:518 length:312 start_codon:yes stop_codon:yes gene_type:complete